MASAVLELAGVRKRYDSLVAVDDLDLALEAGEFLTLLGPSGSGKTTTLMMVAGLQQPDAGSITLNGVSVASLPPYRRDVGMVFQNYALFPHMTVRRNVAFPLEMRGTPAAEITRLVEDALALSIEAAAARKDPRAAEYARRYLARYPSGRFRGMAERVLAR